MKKVKAVKTEAEKVKAQKHERFVSLAVKRVSKALKGISLIGNLSGSGYVYNQDELKKIFDALANQVTVTMNKFNKTKEQKETELFKF